MKFKDFITQQRVTIFIVGIFIFAVSLTIAGFIGFNSEWGELFIDLAASAITVIFTAFIIDYLSLKETSVKTQNAASLAETEIRSTCFRLMLRMATLFGLERIRLDRESITNREEANKYLEQATKRVDEYLSKLDFMDKDTPIAQEVFTTYLESLQRSQEELEQTLILYEYALAFDLRELLLTLRRELQTTERLLGFLDTTDGVSDSGLSMIRVTAKSLYEAIEALNIKPV